MALALTPNAERESSKLRIEPQLVLSIEGLDTLFGAVEILKFIRIGDPGLLIGNDWVIGGLNAIENQSSNISLEGTGTKIDQQLRPDLGSVSSISSIQIALVDFDNFMTQVITPGLLLDDILGRKATLYLGMRNTAWPEDYIQIFSGIIDDIVSAAGRIELNLAHPEQKKRQEIFPKRTSKLDGSISDSDSNFDLLDTDGWLQPVLGPDAIADPSIQYYVRIDDEIIGYTGISGVGLTGCTRGNFGSVAAAHDDGADVASFYTLAGDAVTLALKLMLSGVNGDYKSDVSVDAIGAVPTLGPIPNALYFDGVDLAKKYGLVEGDYVSLDGSLSDFTLRQIVTLVSLDQGSYAVMDGAALALELSPTATVSFRSQYDTLGEGMALTPDEVDVEEHLFWQQSQLATYTYFFYLKDTLNGKDFLDKEVYAPIGAYSIPRKGRCSMGYHIGPIARDEVPTIDRTNIKNPSSIKMRRTINKNFYNTIVYKYDESAFEEKFNGGTIYADADSRARIPVGNKVLSFASKGLRSDQDAAGISSRSAARFLSRYKFGAEHFDNIRLLFKGGWTVEPGDIILFDPSDLKVSNTVDGTRNKTPKFFEVTNKSLDLKTGEPTISITDTNFDNTERYGVVAPSSILASGSTSEALVLEDSYGALYPGNESRKWRDYVGLTVLVHNEDFSYSEEVTLLSLDPVDTHKIYISALVTPPTAGLIVDVPDYPTSTDTDENQLYKLFHPFLSARVDVVSAADDTHVTVGSGDIAKFLVGATVMIHNEDYSVMSAEVLVDAIIGNTLTLSAGLGFTPTSDYFIQFIGFADGGKTYRIF